MATNPLLEKVARLVGGLKFAYLDEDASDFGSVDYGVLTVAMMVAALDGKILPEELAAFRRLSEKCRVSPGEHAAYYDRALRAAGYIMIQRGILGEERLVETFVAEAGRVLPEGFVGGKAEDVRRAVAIWTAMGLSDGEFSGIERACVEAVLRKAAEKGRQAASGGESLWVSTIRGLFGRAEEASEMAPGDRIRDDFFARVRAAVVAGDDASLKSLIING